MPRGKHQYLCQDASSYRPDNLAGEQVTQQPQQYYSDAICNIVDVYTEPPSSYQVYCITVQFGLWLRLNRHMRLSVPHVTLDM